MKQILFFPMLACLLASVSISAQEEKNSMEKAITVGDDAPDWELVGSDGKTYKLSEYKDNQAVVVAWYPAAMTGG